MHSVTNAEETPTGPQFWIPSGPIDAIRFAPQVGSRVFWNLFWLAVIATAAWYIGNEGAGGFAFFLWAICAAFGVALLYFVTCIFASKRSGIRIPQMLIDPDGITKIGLFRFRFHAWAELSDMVVAAYENDGSFSYELLAFAKDQTLPERDADKRRVARLTVSLPALHRSGDEASTVHNSLCRYLNGWRRYVMDGGAIPNRWQLQGIAELVDVTALSKAELEASWRAIRARY